MRPDFDSIIFDMDGTLWDAVDLYAEAWNTYFKSQDVKYMIGRDFLLTQMGLEEEIYLSRVLPEYSKEKRKEVYHEIVKIQYELIEKKGGLLYEGVIEGLKRLSGHYKLFIVSNCPEYTIKYFIKSCDINSLILDSLAHGDNFKPKHENIKEIIERNNLVNPVYVGDTDSDRIECEKAGIPFIFMEYGFGSCNDFLFKFPSFKEFTLFMLNE